MIVTLDGVSRNTKDTQYGPKEQLGIKVVESKVFDINGLEITVSDRWLNTYNTKGTEGWDKGMKVNVLITEKDGKYLNFKPADAGAQPPSELEVRVKRLEDKVFGTGVESKEEIAEPDDF